MISVAYLIADRPALKCPETIKADLPDLCSLVATPAIPGYVSSAFLHSFFRWFLYYSWGWCSFRSVSWWVFGSVRSCPLSDGLLLGTLSIIHSLIPLSNLLFRPGLSSFLRLAVVRQIFPSRSFDWVIVYGLPRFGIAQVLPFVTVLCWNLES